MGGGKGIKSGNQKPRCGICGKQGKLMKTECCGNWICDDEDQYVIFSYERNSCSRNHRRLTLCSHHHVEEHPGDWKDCPLCRKDFETEMYVWYGTNEYNFEKLENPPAYQPTRCSVCNRIIRLATDGYTQSAEGYKCEHCSQTKTAKPFAGNNQASPEEGSSTGRTKVGRNDPCPCGSGKKYKRCCYGKETGSSTTGHGPTDVLADLKEAMKDKDFGSFAELQAFVGWHTGMANRTPIDDFQGISSEQMHRFLHFPFSSPNLVSFPQHLANVTEAPIMDIFDMLVTATEDKGLRATQKGNLARDFVRKVALHCVPEDEKHLYPGINSEPDFMPLHVTRLVSNMAGLIHKYRGRFVQTARFRKLYSQNGVNAAYPLLFSAFVEQFNWGFQDRYPDFTIIQQSFLFSLWLFHRFGDEWREPSFYADLFVRAFPRALDEAEEFELPYTTPDGLLRSCYVLRCLERFAIYFGLVDVEWESKGFINRRFKLKKSSLLDQVVKFHI